MSLLLDHSEDVEADLARWYPRDADQLDAFYDGRMSLRRLWVLVSKLPQDSNVSRAVHGEEADWTLEAHLLAQIANLTIAANGQRGGKRVPKSHFIKVPGADAPKKPARDKPEKKLTQAEFDALFEGG